MWIIKQIQKKIGLLFWFYTVVIILLCVLPINASESSLNNISIVSVRLDYLVHIFLFIPWMLLWKYYTKQSFDKSMDKTILLISVGCLFAFSTEIVQLYLPYRAFNINDLIANIVGVGIGIVFFLK